MKIDITGLPKEEVILRLFKNVFNKSEHSQATLFNTMHESGRGGPRGREPIDLYSVPDKHSIKDILNNAPNRNIDYIGVVLFKMDFSGSTIDTTKYDSEHKTDSTPGIQTASACIEELKTEINILDIPKDDDSSTLKASDNTSKLKAIEDILSKELGKLHLTYFAYTEKVDAWLGGKAYTGSSFRIPGTLDEIYNALNRDVRVVLLEELRPIYKSKIAKESKYKPYSEGASKLSTFSHFSSPKNVSSEQSELEIQISELLHTDCSIYTDGVIVQVRLPFKTAPEDIERYANILRKFHINPMILKETSDIEPKLLLFSETLITIKSKITQEDQDTSKMTNRP